MAQLLCQPTNQHCHYGALRITQSPFPAPTALIPPFSPEITWPTLWRRLLSTPPGLYQGFPNPPAVRQSNAFNISTPCRFGNRRYGWFGNLRYAVLPTSAHPAMKCPDWQPVGSPEKRRVSTRGLPSFRVNRRFGSFGIPPDESFNRLPSAWPPPFRRLI